jgi:hypothetical protein
MNSKERKLLTKIPKESSDILEYVGSSWKVLSYRTEGPGWHAEVEIHKRKFLVSSEYFCISVEEYDEQSRGKWRLLLPSEGERTAITARQIANLIVAALA